MTRRLTSALIALATALGGFLFLLGAAESAQAEEIIADMKSNAYEPGSLLVKVGDTVTWTNSDTVPHTVTSDDGGPLDSGIIDGGASWSYTFTEPGTYTFFCEVHPNMKGTVTVVEDEPTTTTAAEMPGHEMPTTTVGTAPPPSTEPPESPTTTTTAPPVTGMPSRSECGGVLPALDDFMVHFNAAHLEESPGQQVADALAVDEYVLVHTVLVENMLDALLGSLDVFMVHVNAAHLEESPGQQVADALAVDDYALTHTVLVEKMISSC